MITETENNAIQLAKKVFEHFTRDALPIAREIIALENEMKEEQDNGVTIPVLLKPSLQVEPDHGEIHVLPSEAGSGIRIAGPLNHARMQAVEETAVREFEEIPY